MKDKGHIDEVCWLFSTPEPTQEQFRKYDALLEEEGWDLIFPEGTEDEIEALREECLEKMRNYERQAERRKEQPREGSEMPSRCCL